jgi:hypothetical protein
MAELGEGLSGYLDVQDATLRAPRLEAVSNIGIANTAPQHAFSVGSNLYVDTESSNVLTVDGNVVCEGVKVGLIEIIPSYDLAAVSNVGNVTQSTIQFSNATTGFVTTANIEVGTANLFVDTVSGRVGIGKTDPGATLDVTGNAYVSSNLEVGTANLFVDTVSGRVGVGTDDPGAELHVMGDIIGRSISKTRTITKGASLSDETETFTLNPDENRIVLNNNQGSIGSTRIYRANFTSGVPTTVGTVLHLEINSQRVNTDGVGRGHQSVIQFDGTSILDTGYIVLGATGGNDSYDRQLQRTIILTDDGWKDYSMYPKISAPTTDDAIIFSTTEHAISTDLGNTELTERMRITNTGNVGIGTTDPGTKLHVNGDLRIGSSPNDTVDDDNSREISTAGQLTIKSNDSGLNNSFVNLVLQSGNTNPGKIVIGGGTADEYRDIEFYTSGSSTERMRIHHNGNVGIGSDNPAAKLDVNGEVHVESLRIKDSTFTNDYYLRAKSSDTAEFFVGANAARYFRFTSLRASTLMDRVYAAAFGPFTGSHICYTTEPAILNNYTINYDEGHVSKHFNSYGLIVQTTGKLYGDTTISETRPFVELSKTSKSLSVYGVLTDSTDNNEYVICNSIGEGAIWVSNENGNLINGDYICSSNLPGYGMKQDDDLQHSYTVAKIIESCDFTVTSYTPKEILCETIQVETYYKLKDIEVSEDIYNNLEETNRKIVTETITQDEYDSLDEKQKELYINLTKKTFIKITKEPTDKLGDNTIIETSEKKVPILDTNGDIQWVDGDEQKIPYKIRYLDADGNITDEANHVYKAAFVGCTYHCG